MIIVYMVLGAILWQLVCVVAAIFNDYEEVPEEVSFGVWGLLLLAYGWVRDAIHLHRSRKYNGYYGFTDSSIPITIFYMTPETAAQFRTVEEYGYNYAIQLHIEGKDFKHWPEKSLIVDEMSLSRTARNFLKTP